MALNLQPSGDEIARHGAVAFASKASGASVRSRGEDQFRLSVLIRQVVVEELLNQPTVSKMMEASVGSVTRIGGPIATAGHAMTMRVNLHGHGVINFGQTFKYREWSPHTVAYSSVGLHIQEFRARMGAHGAPLDRVQIPGSSGAYPHLAKFGLAALMKDSRLSDAQLAQQMRLFQQGSPKLGGLNPEQLAMMGATAHLIFGVESARNVGNFVTAPMTAQLVEEGHLTMKQALTAKGQHLSLPLAGPNAPKQSRGLEARIAEQTGIEPRVGGQGNIDDAKAMASREKAVIIGWVTKVAGGEVATGSEKSIRMHVRQLVRDWYMICSNSANR